MDEKLDKMVKPWWLMPRTFVGILALIGVSIVGYAVAEWWIKKYIFDLISRIFW